MKPNLFDYATSELSQDAFLCWLLKWGEVRFKSVNPELNRIATQFIHEIFLLHEESLGEEINEIVITQQFKGLDILAIINKRFAIMIEDKTFTSDHSGQLERYFHEIQSDFSTKDYQPLPIYYKIIEQSNYESVQTAGYKIFTRKQMIDILESHDREVPMNSILSDYLRHLKRLDKSLDSYKSLPVKEWTAFSWQGFYRDLQNRLDGKWGYVSNPNGGFWGFWWKGHENQIHYWQLEEALLKAKIEVDANPDIKTYRDECMADLLEQSNLHNLYLVRPKYIRTGKTMTIAKRDDYLCLNEEGILDFEKTVAELRRYGQYSQ